MARIFIILAIPLSMSMLLHAQEPVGPQGDILEAVAEEFVALLAKGDFSAAVESFDAAMVKAMPPRTLQQTWVALIGQAGPFQKRVGTRRRKIRQYEAVFVTCQFERILLDIKVVLNSDRQVCGLFFLPAPPSHAYRPPPYGDPDSFLEKDVSVGTGTWAVPGTLSLPRGKGPFPAVILVHGSGPQDRDETIGPNKPFRDLAWGLASQGVAVLRYEKRTKHHAALLRKMSKTVTVEEETIQDALCAVALLQSTTGVDGKSIFVLGHSLGGMLAPRIAMQHRGIAGLIIMAGTSRPMEDVIYEQFQYIFSLDDQLTDEERQRLEELASRVRLVKSEALTMDTPAELLPLGVPAAYWLDLRHYAPAKQADALTIPMLILQGKRDYQVTTEDFQAWRDALSSHDNVRFKLYPSLNHLFIHGRGRIMPVEYAQPGHVHESVIGDIIGWIRDVSVHP